MKLNAPKIVETIPAFFGPTLIVPFENDFTVAETSVSDMVIIIKDLYSNKKESLEAEGHFNLKEGWAQFDVSNLNLAEGFFYKIQIAYIDKEGVIGYYSSVGLVKYTKEPKVSILNLAPKKINILRQEFSGIYTNSDLTEKLYSSYFVIKDSFGNIVQQSEEKIHNSVEDIDNEQLEKIKINFNYNNNSIYTIQFCGKTINGLSFESEEYQITQEMATAPQEFFGGVVAENILEEGYIKIKLNPLADTSPLLNGQYVLSRIQTDTNERVNLKYLNVSFFNYSTWEFKDYLIENGKTYVYTFSQYNQNGLFLNEKKSNSVIAKYDYIFLFDGEKQLKLKYDAKASSFKENVLETKIDTIGNQYPFIFRNGNVKYKEFPVGGLIKYEETDIEKRLMTDSDQIIIEQDKYAIEKEWKIKTLSWLNNGKIKLYKSPTEGMYFVRLLNISLTPKEGLGGWLHNFSATAYEAATINSENYLKYGFLNEKEEEHFSYNYQSIDLSKVFLGTDESNNKQTAINGDKIILDFSIIDMVPGNRFFIQLVNDHDYKEIKVGNTGSYSIKNIPIQKITLAEEQPSGILTFKYLQKQDIISEILDIKTDLYLLSLLGDFNNTDDGFSNLYFLKENNKFIIQNLLFAFFEKQDIVICQQLPDSLDALKIYCKVDNNSKVLGIYSEKNKETGITNNVENYINNLYKIEIKHKGSEEKIIIDINNKINYKLPKEVLNNIESIKIGYGVKIDLGFYLKEQFYSFEDDSTIQSAKAKFLNEPTETNYNNYISLFS